MEASVGKKQEVYGKLAELQIPYRSMEHAAVYTIEEMQALLFPPGAVIAKNLFLRDAKGKRHFLVVAEANAKIDLGALGAKLGGTRLSFASDERLGKYLGLTKGAVSPFGLLNDGACGVEFYLDEKLRPCQELGVHPNDNTATVFLTCADLVKFAEATGHKVNWVRFG